MAQAVAADSKKKSAWRALGLALSNRKTGFMLLFGFAQGLPPALFLGTLYAWLSEADVDLIIQRMPLLKTLNNIAVEEEDHREAAAQQ